MDKKETELFVRRLFEKIDHQLNGRTNFTANIEYGSNNYDEVVPQKVAEVKDFLRKEGGLSTVKVSAGVLGGGEENLKHISFNVSVAPKEQQKLEEILTKDWQKMQKEQCAKDERAQVTKASMDSETLSDTDYQPVEPEFDVFKKDPPGPVSTQVLGGRAMQQIGQIPVKVEGPAK